MHCVDLGESFPTSIYLQNLVSLQPRTSPLKILADTPSSFSWRRSQQMLGEDVDRFDRSALNSAKFQQNFWQKFEIGKRCKGVYCVDVGESFHLSLYLQNLVSIQPRTSPVKFAWSSEISPQLPIHARTSTDAWLEARVGRAARWSRTSSFSRRTPFTAPLKRKMNCSFCQWIISATR